MPRPRSLELSSMQILVVGVNAAGKVVSWSTLPDPRILRAESERPDGTLAGQIIERTATDFLVPLHDDNSISTIRIYHPEWTGESFRLDLVGSIALPN